MYACMQLHRFIIIHFHTAMECPAGMIYQQCGLLCPQTCDNNGASDCIAGCAEGCFCPVGQVVHNGECIVPIACPS